MPPHPQPGTQQPEPDISAKDAIDRRMDVLLKQKETENGAPAKQGDRVTDLERREIWNSLRTEFRAQLNNQAMLEQKMVRLAYLASKFNHDKHPAGGASFESPDSASLALVATQITLAKNLLKVKKSDGVVSDVERDEVAKTIEDNIAQKPHCHVPEHIVESLKVMIGNHADDVNYQSARAAWKKVSKPGMKI